MTQPDSHLPSCENLRPGFAGGSLESLKSWAPHAQDPPVCLCPQGATWPRFNPRRTESTSTHRQTHLSDRPVERVTPVPLSLATAEAHLSTISRVAPPPQQSAWSSQQLGLLAAAGGFALSIIFDLISPVSKPVSTASLSPAAIAL